MIINTVTSIAQEIYEEMGEPNGFSIAAIAAWVRRNIGGLGNMLGNSYEINNLTLEINPNLTDVEKYIFKKMYSIYYFDLQIKSTGSLATTDFITIKDDIGSVQKGNKNEVLKSYIIARKEEYSELKKLATDYKSNNSSPLQVAGDDTIEGHYNPTYTKALRRIRSIYSSS